MAMGQNPNLLAHSEHPNPSTKIPTKMGGAFTYPKMVPLVLTHSQMGVNLSLKKVSASIGGTDQRINRSCFLSFPLLPVTPRVGNQGFLPRGFTSWFPLVTYCTRHSAYLSGVALIQRLDQRTENQGDPGQPALLRCSSSKNTPLPSLRSPLVSHTQSPVQKWSTQNHASRTKKVDIRIYLLAGIVPY